MRLLLEVFKPLLFLGLFLLSAGTVCAQSVTYYWQGANGTLANWSTLTNWNTSPTGAGVPRPRVLDTDILIIQGGTLAAPKKVNVDFAASGESIGRLTFRDYVELHVPTSNNTATIKNLTITGRSLVTGSTFDETANTPAIDDLVAESGSNVKVYGDGANGNNSTRSNLNFILGTNTGPYPNATAYIAGTMLFTGPAGTNGNGEVTHTFQGNTAGTVRFVNGSSLTVDDLPGGDSYVGVSFAGAAGLAVFESGSTFTQKAGEDVYGPALFNEGSTYVYVSGNTGTTPTGAGIFGTLTSARTYGNLSFQNTIVATMTGAFQLTILDDLTKIAGTAAANINVTGTGTGTSAAVSIGGDVQVTNGSLNFNPASTSTVAFNSPIAPATTAVAQNFLGTSPLTFNTNALFEVNNSAGLIFQRSVTLGKGLVLTSGLITTTATQLLIMPAAATVSGGSSTSYVNGPMVRTTTSGASPNMVFPVGKSGNYRPMTLNITAQTNAVNYTGEQIELPPTPSVTSPLTRVSFRRYFTLVPNVAPTGLNATVTLSFGTDDFVNYPADASFVIARRDGTNPWTSLGRSTNTGTATNGAPVAGTLTSAAFTTFPTTTTGYTLGSTLSTIYNAFPGINPLPVELTRFDATAKGAGVSVNWATASEKNSDRFEVQRSIDGTAFETIGTIKGQGTSTSTHEYTFVDSQPVDGLAYYRLHQVDVDGTDAYSPVATANWGRTLEAVAYPNPSTDVLTLPASLGEVHYRIYNLLGQTLLSGQAAGNARLDVTALPKGPFFLELTGQTGRSIQRLLRQ